MKVLVTGVAGQLGHDVMNELAKRDKNTQLADTQRDEEIKVAKADKERESKVAEENAEKESRIAKASASMEVNKEQRRRQKLLRIKSLTIT